MVSPPKNEIMEELKQHCLDNNLGMSASFGDEFGIIVFGSRNYRIDHIALICASYLLNGVLSGIWDESNKIAENNEKPFIVPGPDRSQ